ncbi:MAG: ArnT family glycosyltransferase [Syntrophobacteraceae bacterium]
MQRSTTIKILLILAAITFLVRLPYLFGDVIDPDEGSFVLMGQDIVDGNLPYDRLWDLKPPLLFYFFAATIAVFGKSIPAVRFTGSLCAFAGAWLIFLCAQRLRGAQTGFIAALLFLITSTLSESGAGVVSEIIAVVPLMAAMLVMSKDQLRSRDFFLAGLFICLACLVRLNLAYVAVAGGLLLLSGKFIRTNVRFWQRLLPYIAGGIIPLLLVFIPYVLKGKEHLFYTSVIYAPLNYSNSQLSSLQAMRKYIGSAFEPARLLVGFPIFACLLLGAPKFFSVRKEFSDSTKTFLAMLTVFAVATAFSIVKSGAAFEHYLIQVLPFAAIFSAFFLEGLLQTRWKRLVVVLSALYLLLPLGQIASAYEVVLSRAGAGQTLVYGPCYEIAAYLKTANPKNKPVYFMGGQMGEWLLGLKPISKEVTTPSNIGREYILKALDGPSATTYSVLASILAKKPQFIVKESSVWYLTTHPRASGLLSQELFMDYEPVREIGAFLIYKRLS